MANFFSGLLRNGKTVAGAVVTLAGTVIGLAAQLSPEDLAALTSVAAGAGTFGQVMIAVGLADKLRKLYQGKPAL